MIKYNNYSKKLELLKSNTVSLRENVNCFLDKIEEQKYLNAFNFIFKDTHQQAEIISAKINEEKAGKLAGMVIAVKDVLAAKNRPLTCSSNILTNFNSLYHATAVEKLIAEDAIIIGKTNCDEFAMGSSNENSAFGNVLNPIDNKRVPGGSSGGSAVAVAAGLCDCALGTDTGGSVRQPASFVGVFGLKPTYGRISRFGLTAFASSFDSIGIFSNSTEDIAMVLEVISGKDENDSTSQTVDVPEYSSKLKLDKKFKIGIPKEYFSEGLNDEIRNAIFEKIDFLISDGFEIINIELPHTEYAIAAYYILTTAEASSNLARYDGVRFGRRAKIKDDLINMYIQSRTDGFGKEVKRRIMLGTYVLSSGYYEAYYAKAQKVRRLFKQDFDDAFQKVDIILTPTSPTIAFKIGEKLDDPLAMYLSDIYTTSANLAGIPAINIPIVKSEEGLPIGLQLMADQFEEVKLLQMSNYLQSMNVYE